MPIEDRLRARDAALAALAARVDAAEQARDTLVRTAGRQAVEILRLTARLTADEPDRAELLARLQAAQAELDAMRASAAWRLTAPLRPVVALWARAGRWMERRRRGGRE